MNLSHFQGFWSGIWLPQVTNSLSRPSWRGVTHAVATYTLPSRDSYIGKRVEVCEQTASSSDSVPSPSVLEMIVVTWVMKRRYPGLLMPHSSSVTAEALELDESGSHTNTPLPGRRAGSKLYARCHGNHQATGCRREVWEGEPRSEGLKYR